MDKAIGYGVVGERADGNDVLAVYDVTKRAVDRARRGEGVTLIELVTYRRKGHAEHDNQSYVPEGEIEQWAAENDPIDRFIGVLQGEGVSADELAAIDARVVTEVDDATDTAEASPMPEPIEALRGVHAGEEMVEPALVSRSGPQRGRRATSAPEGWGTWNG